MNKRMKAQTVQIIYIAYIYNTSFCLYRQTGVTERVNEGKVCIVTLWKIFLAQVRIQLTHNNIHASYTQCQELRSSYFNIVSHPVHSTTFSPSRFPAGMTGTMNQMYIIRLTNKQKQILNEDVSLFKNDFKITSRVLIHLGLQCLQQIHLGEPCILLIESFMNKICFNFHQNDHKTTRCA